MKLKRLKYFSEFIKIRNIREFEILSTYPDEFYFSQYLGRIKWVDDKTVVIEQKNGINYLLIDINKGIIKDWSEKE